MSQIDWNAAGQYASLVKIAASIDPAGEFGAAQIAQIKALGYAYVDTIYGAELATDLNAHAGETVTFGFLALSVAGELVAAIRGTATISDWVHDIMFLMTPCPITGAHGFTEDGFTAVYRSLRVGRGSAVLSPVSAIEAKLTSGAARLVTIAGHSLGGALATLLTVDVALNTACKTPTSYTYASPRVGDTLFASTYNAMIVSSFRIYNRQDLVPNLPLPFPLPYDHVNTGLELVAPANAIVPTIPCMHALTTYLWLIDQRVGGGHDPLDANCAMPMVAMAAVAAAGAGRS
jgi:hypothetical protein